MATTNNIGLYCFNTGEEDAKTSLEALFGAGNSNMKKIDDAIGELKKKSFIVNTEEELNALLTEENLGKTVSYNGALYVIAEGGSSNTPIAVGDTLDTLYFDTSVTPDFSNISWGKDGLGTYMYFTEGAGLGVFDLSQMGVDSDGYIMLWNDSTFLYSSKELSSEFMEEFWGEAVAVPQGWNADLIANGGVLTLDAPDTVSEIDNQSEWSSYISKEPFGESTGGGIIAKPVGAEGGGLPSFAPEDAGKFLRVDSNGNIVAEAIAYAEGESF